MKELEELGISPAPWKVNDHASVLDRDFVIISGQYGPYNWHNARLIAAAPKLYKTEYSLVDVIERLLNGWCGTCDVPSQEEVVKALEASKNALVEAAGEEAKA